MAEAEGDLNKSPVERIEEGQDQQVSSILRILPFLILANYFTPRAC
jgi:hypothetical protein